MSEQTREFTFFAKIIGVLIPLLLILGGGAAWFYFQATAPVMKKARPQRQAVTVKTRAAEVGGARVMISSMGTVTAARQITLKAQVSGTVATVSQRFMPGSLVTRGEQLLHLDPSDYKVAVKKAQSALDNAKASLAIELGNQNIAKQELRVLAEMTSCNVSNTDLALRKPQLAKAKADVASAGADLTQARLDLSRTRIIAPFNAIILERSVNVGAYVGAKEDLLTLAGTDEFWVKAMVSLDELAYIDLDHPGGCKALIRSQTGTGCWEGRVVQATGKLNDSSRMATMIVAIENPLGTRDHSWAQPLMIDDYVNVQITGRAIEKVVKMPRAALKDNDCVWINSDNTLDIRKVTLAWKDAENVYIKQGITQGEHVVVSGLDTPVQGMALIPLNPFEQTLKVSKSAGPADHTKDPS